jgi:HEAT repeat protein
LEMSKRAAITILLAVVLCVCLLLVWLTSEPHYQGKSLSEWIRGLEYENHNPTDEQRAALRAMGEPAVRRLIALLKRHDSPLKRKFVDYAEDHPEIFNRFIARRYVIPESVYHAEAATALGEIGPAAREAIPALTDASNDTDFIISMRARAALMKIREEPIAPLLAELTNTTSTNWLRTARTVKYLGTNGEAAVPILVSALRSTNFWVRWHAVWGLEGIASRPDVTVPALIGCLQDKDPDIRRNAIDGLCHFKEAKQEVVPQLLSCMGDTNLNVWLGAAFGLEKLLNEDEKRKLYVPALVKSLNSPTEIIRENAKMFLKRVDPAAAAKAGVK